MAPTAAAPFIQSTPVLIGVLALPKMPAKESKALAARSRPLVPETSLAKRAQATSHQMTESASRALYETKCQIENGATQLVSYHVPWWRVPQPQIFLYQSTTAP